MLSGQCPRETTGAETEKTFSANGGEKERASSKSDRGETGGCPSESVGYYSGGSDEEGYETILAAKMVVRGRMEARIWAGSGMSGRNSR